MGTAAFPLGTVATLAAGFVPLPPLLRPLQQQFDIILQMEARHMMPNRAQATNESAGMDFLHSGRGIQVGWSAS